MLFGKSIVVLSVLFFVSWAEEHQPSDHGVSKEADQDLMKPVGTETGNDYPRQKRGNVVGVAIHQEGNVFEGRSDKDNVGVYVSQQNNVFRNNDPEGNTYQAVIHQNNTYRNHSAETDSIEHHSNANSAKPRVQNHQYVTRNQEFEYRPAPIYPTNYTTGYSANQGRQTSQAPPNYINVQLNGPNGPIRQARLLQPPVYRPQFSERTMNNNLQMLKERLEQLEAEVKAQKEILMRLAKLLNLYQ